MRLCLELIILLPLAGAVVNALFGRNLPRRVSEITACGVVWGSFCAAVAALFSYSSPATIEIASWLSDFEFKAPLTLYLDPLALSLVLMITFVCGLIHIYAVAYMTEDPCHVRFFALLNLFVSSMLLLVLAGNLPLMYMGWEGVGLCSYGLIGFWYREEKNATAGRKAFIVTRIGDTALLIALVWLFELCGTESIPELNALAGTLPSGAVTVIGFLILLGAMGKSAQLPLSVWLPDAMAGPTPVSALIHAATMVTAGVYLLMRLFPFISGSPELLAGIAITGGVTAFYGATCAVAQRDLKRVLAYSTISQIGYMFLGVGAGSVSAATFHLIVHAFFKALLFLGAGCVINALHHEQDIYRMGGLRRALPATFWPFLAGAACLAGIPPSGGFFSKDGILAAAWGQGGPVYSTLFGLGLVTALLTSFYSFRMLYLVFGGEQQRTTHGVSRIMEWILVPLALLGLLGGFFNLPAYFGTGILSGFLEPLTGTLPAHLSHGSELALQGVAAIVAVWGIALAHYRYGGERRNARVADMDNRATWLRSFCLNGWYLDRLYGLLLVRPYQRLAGILWEQVDEGAIDGSLDRFATFLGRAGRFLGSWGGGRVSAYLFSMAAGAALVIAYLAWVMA
ncbi:NADH-quinone oxidoreductase subunit L [Geobacter pelophilus]|uniref:NADH-quinone oxidoreductase subunit L n=1 Tax=Geoanaerobacter pelophilus TaxID=60036 RepID=A0AAW4L3C1_9BACT|nr:NADH-quinone oxidoreductase subunit L [Geoanaerobacter pelophilus]MBT0664697.1 NADH-quinone oxidoreductase subunit L [Geoanaerobacter pelophilus]